MEAANNHPFYRVNVRSGNMSDIESVCDLGILFFEESNFKELTIDVPRFKEVMQDALSRGELDLEVAEYDNVIVGFLVWGMERYYTVETLASMFLFYVHPEFRSASSAGKDLLRAATEEAKARGAKAFYAASTAGISAGVDTRMENMLLKNDFELLGRFGRKIL